MSANDRTESKLIAYLNIWINTLERSEADAVVGFVSDNTVLHKLLKL